jgi:hypothetical protein
VINAVMASWVDRRRAVFSLSSVSIGRMRSSVSFAKACCNRFGVTASFFGSFDTVGMMDGKRIYCLGWLQS